jgi:hypothetical protein
MAKVLTDSEGVTHLRNIAEGALCGGSIDNATVTDGVLTCPTCAKIALHAVELVTKAEKREWRQL